MANALLMISDGKQFWSTNEASESTQIAAVTPIGTFVNYYDNLDHLARKSVFIFVHGYKVSSKEMLNECFQVKERVEQVWKNGERVVIGYHAPLRDHGVNSIAAEKQVDQLAPRLAHQLKKLSLIASSVDVVAHGFGTRLVLAALQMPPARVHWINHLFCWAPIVNDPANDRSRSFFSSLCKCKEVTIFYSQFDAEVQIQYPSMNWCDALGYEGPKVEKRLPLNVQEVDCTAVVESHSKYITAPALYAFMRNRCEDAIPSPLDARKVQILSNGDVEELPCNDSCSLTQAAKIVCLSMGVFLCLAWIYRA